MKYISLGYDCSPALALKELKLRDMAYPFDWLQMATHKLKKCLETDFSLFLSNPRLLNGTRIYDSYGIQYPHDLPNNNIGKPTNEVELKQVLPDIIAKYKRRIDRFRKVIDTEDIIFVSRSHDPIILYDIITKLYPKLRFVIVSASLPPIHPNPRVICCSPDKKDDWNNAAIWKEAIDKAELILKKVDK